MANRKSTNLFLWFGAWVALFAAFVVVEIYGLSPAGVFAVASAAIFFRIVGWRYKRLLRSPEFLGFFAAWTVLHVVVFLAVLGYLGFLYYVPILALELWVGYTIAILKFGPPDKEEGPKNSER